MMSIFRCSCELRQYFNLLKNTQKKTKFLWSWGIITLFMLPIGISAQVVVPTQISPRLIYQGEDFYTGHGVKEILIEIENTTLSDSDSDYPSCNIGTADIDLSYITNNFSDYWVTLWLPSPQARDGLSTIDLILMIRHATGKDQFDNYDFVAADANNDGTVDTANDVNAWRAVVLNPSLPYPGGDHFFLIQNTDKSNFENANQDISLYSFSAGFDQFTYYDDPAMSEDNLFSYRIIKRGDVNASNCNYCPNNCAPSYLKKPEHFTMPAIENEYAKIRLKVPVNTDLIGLEWLVEDLSGYSFEIMNLESNLKGFYRNHYRLDKDAMNISYTHVVDENSRSSSSGSQYYIDLSVHIPDANARTQFIDVIRSSSLTGWDQKLEEVYDFTFEVQSDEISERLSAEVFPNPVENELNIRVTSGFNRPISLILFDVIGRKHYEKSSSIESGSNLLRIPMTGLDPGIYFLKGQDEAGILFSKKIIKVD